ncbi:MAG: glycosyltransferase family 4 protein [Chloroflexota bacterium]|nr:glycosyltransferase family 4 protein [Chloroflexota bacterium]
MRVAVDLLIAEKEPGGMLFATRALLEGLACIDQENEYIVITSQPKAYKDLAAAPSMHIYPVKLHTWRGILIQHQLKLPDILKKLKPDVLHVPAFAAPIGWHGPLVLTVHDLAFLKVPQQSSLYARLYWQHMLRESVRRAQQIIAVSEQTRSELFACWHVEPERVHVIYNALRPSLKPEHIMPGAIAEMRLRYGGRYLLHVGRIMPRKNVEMLIQAFSLLAERFAELHLVLAGGVGYGSAEVLQLISASPYRERIHQIGWVAEQDMGPLYAAAEMLVFPSKHEGFGLPSIEAMACGTPVIASLETASAEITGNAAVCVDCSRADCLADAIAEMLSDQALRERLISRGLARATFFTKERSAYATRLVYQKALDLDVPTLSPAIGGVNARTVLPEKDV